MKKYSYLIIIVLISGLVLAGCSLLSNVGQVPATEQSGITYLTKAIDSDPGLVGLWRFDEGSGTTAADSSGNANDGTVYGASWVSPGKFGNALSFDGIFTGIQAGGDYVLFQAHRACTSQISSRLKLGSNRAAFLTDGGETSCA